MGFLLFVRYFYASRLNGHDKANFPFPVPYRFDRIVTNGRKSIRTSTKINTKTFSGSLFGGDEFWTKLNEQQSLFINELNELQKSKCIGSFVRNSFGCQTKGTPFAVCAVRRHAAERRETNVLSSIHSDGADDAIRNNEETNMYII